METNNLKWSASASASWIELNQTTGEGDTRLSVNVQHCDVRSTDTTGTVTVSCTNCQQLPASARTKTIEVCRCACDCPTVSPIIYNIEESGLTTGAVIGTYNLLARCDDNAMSVVVENDYGIEVTAEAKNGEIKLTKAIPYNEVMEEKEFYVKVYFDKDCRGCNGAQPSPCPGNTPCGEWTITQKALECNCNVSLKNFMWHIPELPNTIPQAGLGSGTIIFSFINKEFCPIDSNVIEAELIFNDGTEDNTIGISLSEGSGEYEGKIVGKLQSALGENTSTSNRNVIVNISYNGTTSVSPNCKNKTFNQLGCNCQTALVRTDDDCGVAFDFTVGNVGGRISTFGNEIGDTIGYFIINTATTCGYENISVTLKQGRIPYTIIIEAPDANGKCLLKLGGTRVIPENTSKNDKTFKATLIYAGTGCCLKDIKQPGVNCNCDDINGRLELLYNDSTRPIPKTGLTVSHVTPTVFGEYRLVESECSDANDCFKVVDIRDVGSDDEGIITLIDNPDAIKLQLVSESSNPPRGKIILQTEIPNNEDPLPISYQFVVIYKVNNKWRKCSEIDVMQLGLQCSCEMVEVINGEEWVSFSSAGTLNAQGENVPLRFARADTGLYKYKGDPDREELVGVCGSLSANSDNAIIIPVDGYKIQTKPVPLTPEEEAKGLDIPHLYDFYVKIGEIATTTIITSRADLYFIDKDGNPENCNTAPLGFKIDPNACNCEIDCFNLSRTDVPCSGTNGVQVLGTISNTPSCKINSAMTMTAELLKDGETYISCDDGEEFIKEGTTFIDETTFNYEFNQSSKKLTIRGKVGSGNIPGEGEREVGVVRVYFWCNKGELNEIHCGCKDFSIKQKACPKCDCDYVRSHTTISNDKPLKFSFDSTTAEIYIYSGELYDCAYFYMDGVDSDGWKDIGGWCRIRLENDGISWYVYGELTAQQHADRTATVTIKSAYIKGYDPTTGEPIYENCDNYSLKIIDEVCDCDFISGITGSSTSQTITISAGETSGCKYYAWQVEAIGCISFYIWGETDGVYRKYYAKTSNYEKYTYKEEGVELFDVWLEIPRSTSPYIHACVSLKDGITLTPGREYIVEVRTEYTDQNGVIQHCQNLQLKIKQELCDCNKFQGKVSLETFYEYTNNPSGEITLKVGEISSGCGKGTLYVVYGGNKYCASDITTSSWPSELNYIKGITEICVDGYLNLTLDPLDAEHPERTTRIGVCLCDENSTTGCKCNDNCVKEANFVESWSCNATSCSSYNFNLTKVSSDEFIIPCSSSFTHVLVATYPTPPNDCFMVQAITQHSSLTVEQDDIGGGRTGIYISGTSSDQTESPTIDVSVLKKDENGNYTVICVDGKRIDITMCPR